MTNKDIFLLGVGLITFLFCQYNFREKIILICVFVIPLGELFRTELIPVGISGSIILALWVSIKTSHIKRVSWKLISDKLVYLYYFLFVGVFIGLLDQQILDDFTTVNKSIQIYSLSFYLVVVILFVKILNYYSDDFLFQGKIRIAFICSVIIQIMPVLLNYFGINTLEIDESFRTAYDPALFEEVARFSGFFSDYELIVDYVLIIIAFSLTEIFVRKKKILFFILILLTSVYIGLISGTRSFLIILPLLLFNFFMFTFLFKSKRKIQYLIFSVLFTLVFFVLFESFLPKFFVFDRFQDSLNSYNLNGDFSNASNRNFSKLFSELFELISPLGNGSLYFNVIHRNEMVSHNLFFHTYARYGIPGIYLLALLFFNSFQLLTRLISKTSEEKLKIEGIFLLALLVALFIQELKISAIRYQHSMLMYAYFFTSIYFFKRKVNYFKLNNGRS